MFKLKIYNRAIVEPESGVTCNAEKLLKKKGYGNTFLFWIIRKNLGSNCKIVCYINIYIYLYIYL